MKTLTRVVAALALAAFAVPALPCSDMQQTTAQKKVEAPAVAKKDAPQKAHDTMTVPEMRRGQRGSERKRSRKRRSIAPNGGLADDTVTPRRQTRQ